MDLYRVTKTSPRWLFAAYDYIRIDSFCFGQNIPVEAEFEHDRPEDEFQGILVMEDGKPVCGLKISYPRENVARIERVCTIREKQKAGYGRIMIEAAEQWIRENGYSHIVIVSQDRAQGFYEKCGYVCNPLLDPRDILPVKKEPPKESGRQQGQEERTSQPFHHASGFVPDFSVVMVEKYLGA